jgi:asparagine synthase (glutamine-hydrolysing)
VRREPVAELARELRGRLRDSVRAHLDADVPVGVLLSGGVDSGAIAALAAAERGPGVPTFTVGFRERSFDELAAARRVSARLGTDHHEVVVGPEHAELLPAVARAFDEPRGDATALPYWLLARMAGSEVKAVLSGEGGDELFGGYQTYVADRLGARGPRVAAALAPLVERVPASSRRLSLDFRLRRLAGGHGLGPLEAHHAWKELVPAAARRALLADPDAAGGEDPLAPYRALWAESAGAPTVARLQHVDAGTFLADDLLLQADRAAWPTGSRCASRSSTRSSPSWPGRCRPPRSSRGLQTKRVLREAVAPLLPASVVRGPKRGFVPPTAAWLRGPLQGFAREVLGRATLERQGHLRPDAVAALLDRHVERREDLGRPLWALIAFTLWHEAVLEPTPSPLPTRVAP